jgi:hypothetical protein
MWKVNDCQFVWAKTVMEYNGDVVYCEETDKFAAMPGQINLNVI